MSGIEVVGLVAAIVSAFTSATDLFIKWKEKRKDGRKQKNNESAEMVLRTSGSEVQREYDRDFAMLGEAFSKGDRKLSSLLLAES